MSKQKKNKRKNVVFKVVAGKLKINIKPITIITATKKRLKNPKNIVLSILGIVFCSFVGYVLGGIIGTIVAFFISVTLLLLIGPPEKEIIERNKEKIS